MDFQIGDSVMHWTYGLGQVVLLDERVVSGHTTLYYAVKAHDLTVWVPNDDHLGSRLRLPTSPDEFSRLFAILTSKGDPLPDDRHERKIRLLEQLKDGRAESLCQVIRDLFAYQRGKTLNENDQVLLRRAETALLEEWGFALSIPFTQARTDLNRLLDANSV